MNKLIKGSIAGAAGIALLLGGAGTLAVWNDSQTLSNAGTITAGVLDISAPNPGSWDKSIALIVPGDTLTYTQTLNLAATGDNLKFELSNNIASLLQTGGISGSSVTPEFVVKNSAGATQTASNGVYDLPSGNYTIDAKIVVNFPTTVSGLTGQGQSANLSTAAVSVTQVR